MPQVLQIGPVVVPVSLLFMFVAVFTAGFIARRAGAMGGRVESILWQAVVVGLVVARAAFVLPYSASYTAAPLSVLDVRDGGWSPLAGFAAGWLFMAWRLFRERPLRKPLAWAAIAGSTIWGAGLLVLSVPPGKQQSVPPLVLVTLDGSPANLADFRGRPMVVNLWATWCPPCVREMPVLHRAQVAHPAVDFVFINQGETAQRVAPWLSARGLALGNVLLDLKGEALPAFKQRGLPTTLFFDAGGRLVDVRSGELSQATLAERLESISSDARR